MYDSDPEPVSADTFNEAEAREVRPALMRGWRRRCPKCGKGPMMKSYLAVRDHCPVCNENLAHHRADDGPAYLTILIVGFMAVTNVAVQKDSLTLTTGFILLFAATASGVMNYF